MHHHRPLHRRPRHAVSGGDLGLIPAVLDRHRERATQPRRGPHPRRHLPDLLGEGLQWTDHGPAAPPPLVPLQHHRPAATGQVLGTSQRPLLSRGRQLPAVRTPRGVRIVGDQLHDPRPERGEHDTLHRQPGQPQQAPPTIATVNHGPWLSSRCSKTQRGSRSHGPPSFRRAGPWLPGQDRRALLPDDICGTQVLAQIHARRESSGPGPLRTGR